MVNAISEKIEELFSKAEAYVKTTLRLFKLELIKNISDIVSDLFVKIIIFFIAGLALVFASIGLSIWLGDIFGELYYGFFTVALLYMIIAIAIYAARKVFLKNSINNVVITALTKNDKS